MIVELRQAFRRRTDRPRGFLRGPTLKNRKVVPNASHRQDSGNRTILQFPAHIGENQRFREAKKENATLRCRIQELLTHDPKDLC